MKIPTNPPSLDELLLETSVNREGIQRYLRILASGQVDPEPDGKYRHWDILRHLQPPDGFTAQEWWFAVKVARRQLGKPIPLRDREGNAFSYCMTDTAQGMLHEIDKQAGGAIKGTDQVTDPRTRDTYLIKSLFEEAITSSQLEGASTTRDVAKEMLRKGLSPRDRSEQMIYNNYQAMEFIRRLGPVELTPKIVFELHRILTERALDDATAAGRLRRSDENIHVIDEVGRALHIPPAAAELPKRVAAMCEFANTIHGKPFLHPVVRSIFLHFWLAYDHPFVDGNGRTARALFYWSMARHGYWLCEFISISRVIKRAPSRYSRAFLYTETDGNDLTYFLLNQLRTTLQAVEGLHEYLARKAAQLQATRQMITSSRYLNAMLNHRQLVLVSHATKNPGFVYSIDSHKRSHNVSYQTARKDLLELARVGLLTQETAGSSGRGRKAFAFLAPPDLEARLTSLPTATRRHAT